jgi:hypothetical protein
VADRTFKDLQDAVLGDDFAASTWRAEAKRQLLDAVRLLARRMRLPLRELTQAINTAAGTSTYALDALVVRVNSLRNTTDHVPLDEVEIEWIDDQPAARGKPTSFAIVGQSIVFYPTPNAAYVLELRHQGRAADFADDNATLPFDDEWADVPISYARSKLFRAQDDYEAAGVYMNDFETGALRMASDYARRTRTRRRRVPGMFAGGDSGPRFVRP